MSNGTIVGRNLRVRLVEDNPGEHVYRFVCNHCGRECGPEFTLYHASRGGQDDGLPAVGECDCTREAQRPGTACAGRAVA